MFRFSLGLKLHNKTLSFIIANNNTLQLWLGFSVVTVLHYSIYNKSYNVSGIYKETDKSIQIIKSQN